MLGIDVNDDGQVTPLDALLVINNLNFRGARSVLSEAISAPYIDTSGDNFVSPLDVLLVINHLNLSRGVGEGEAGDSLVLSAPMIDRRVDDYFESLAKEAEAIQAENQDIVAALPLRDWQDLRRNRLVYYRVDAADQGTRKSQRRAEGDSLFEQDEVDSILDEIISELKNG